MVDGRGIRSVAQWRGRSFESRSSAPYSTPATGRLWRTIDELNCCARRWRIGRVPPARLMSRT
jgi:hypothetical protein